MNICWLGLLLAFVYGTIVQPTDTARAGAPDLVWPLAGSPLSVNQVEERVNSAPNQTPTVEITNRKIYRDSAGRLRIETVDKDSGETQGVSLIDPATGVRVVLSAKNKTAYRVVGPKAGEDGFAYGVAGLGEALPTGVWRTTTEKLGRRSIDGIEVDGERVTQASADDPSLRAVYEHWHSDEFKLDCVAMSSGPGWKHTARIHILSRQEPDAWLFAIPQDYTVHDLKLPGTSAL
jgi:hypothetical protein